MAAVSLFRYPGGKSKLRHEITQRLARQSTHAGLQYREPFFGGGSIGLTLLATTPGIKHAWLNDKDVGIACLWTSVIRHHEELINRVRTFILSIQAFHDFRAELTAIATMPMTRAEIVEVGFKKLAIHQMSYSGLGTKSGGPLGGLKQNSKYGIDCRWSPDHISKEAHALHSTFKHIDVYGGGCTSLDCVEVIEDARCDGLLYLDPPYFVKGNDLYQQGFTEEDHRRLATALKNTKHAWVLSYDDCEPIRDLYSWACIERLEVNYSITATKDKTTGERRSTTKGELLISPAHKHHIVDMSDPVLDSRAVPCSPC